MTEAGGAGVVWNNQGNNDTFGEDNPMSGVVVLRRKIHIVRSPQSSEVEVEGLAVVWWHEQEKRERHTGISPEIQI